MSIPPADIYDRVPNAYSAVYLRSPIKITKPGKWTGFVCRVSFSTFAPDVQVRVAGGCIVMLEPKDRQTSGLVIGQLDTTALQKQNNDPVFGPDLFTVARGEAKKSENIIVAQPGEHFIDVLFWDCDQNTPDEKPATRVWASLQYLGKPGDSFSVDYSHGQDTSGNDTTEKWLVLRLSSVTFSNGWDIQRDNGSGAYPKPHWNTEASTASLRPCPYLYGPSTSGKNTLQIENVIWTYDTADSQLPPNSFQIRATQVNYDGFYTPATEGIAIPAVPGAVYGGNSLRFATPNVDANKSFYDIDEADVVRFFKPLALNWELSFWEGEWEDAGISENPIYVCRKGVNEFRYPTPYRTVVHLACANAGAWTTDEAVQNTWELFKTRDIRAWNEFTKDFSKPLYYYEPGTNFAQNLSVNVSEKYGASRLFLEQSNGSARCGVWTAFFGDTCWLNANGLSLHFVSAQIDENVLVFENKNVKFFLIKEWGTTTQTVPLTMKFPGEKTEMCPLPAPDAQGRILFGDLIYNAEAIKGQNSQPTVPSEKCFTDHAFFMYRNEQGSLRYLDPSYGVEYSDLKEFQIKAISHVIYDGDVGEYKVIPCPLGNFFKFFPDPYLQ